ncbi:MAG: nucleotide exchange factor GrpE [Clostridia bacterium]|nr:nucleotide exchange factor GrpE [Clostridia bacterium]
MKDKHKHKNCNCDESCDCGCQDGKECTCNDESCDCGCHDEGKECHCNDGEHEHCDCGDDCNCKHEPTIEDYQKAFDQFEQALTKVDAELAKVKQEAQTNQHLAVTYKKDLERYKERNKNIEEESKQAAIENVASKLIPILDQFEVALSGGGDQATKKGYQMIYAGLKRTVEDMGITPIEALGEKFDSKLHSAVSKLKTKDRSKDGVVTAVYQKGYKLNDKIIRYATVEVGECE